MVSAAKHLCVAAIALIVIGCCSWEEADVNRKMEVSTC